MSKNCNLVRYVRGLLKRLFAMGNEFRKGLISPYESRKGLVSPYEFRPFHVERVAPENKCALPQPRSGHRVVCDSKNLYSFGGYNPHIQNEDENDDEIWIESYPLFQELWRYNFASRKWLRYCNRRSLPKELASNAVIRKGNTLMVYICVRFTTIKSSQPYVSARQRMIHICSRPGYF